MVNGDQGEYAHDGTPVASPMPPDTEPSSPTYPNPYGWRLFTWLFPAGTYLLVFTLLDVTLAGDPLKTLDYLLSVYALFLLGMPIVVSIWVLFMRKKHGLLSKRWIATIVDILVAVFVNYVVGFGGCSLYFYIWPV